MSLGTNLTEHERLQEALQASEQRYQKLLESVTDCIYTVKVEGEHAVFTSHSPGCVTVTGYTVAEYAADTLLWDRSIHPEDRDVVTQQVVRLLSGETVPPLEHRIIHKDGSIRWLRNTLVLHQNQQGCIVSYEGLISDITDRKRAEEALRESEHFIQRIAEAIPGIVYIYDLAEGRNIYINHQVSQILGYTAQEIQTLGSQVLSLLVHPDDFVNISAAHQQLPTVSDGEVLEVEYRMKHASGKWRWLLSRDTIFSRNPDGLPKQILGTAQDITQRKEMEAALQEANQELEIRVQERTNELSNAIRLLRLANSQLQQELVRRKQIETALRESEERYALAVSAGKVGVWDWNIETEEIYLDPIVKAMLGYTDYEISDIDVWRKLFHPDDKERMVMAATAHLQGLTPEFTLEHRMLHKDGSIHWFLARGTAIGDSSGKLYRMTGTATDITKRKQAEETIRQQAEWERLLGTIANHIRQSLDLDRILTTTVTELQQLLQSDRVLVFRLEPDGVGRTIAEAVAPKQPTVLEQQFPDEIFPEDCYNFYRQGNVRIVPDIENDEVATCLIEYFVELGVKSKLVVPLLQDESVWGVLSVHYCTESPRQWQEWEIGLLKRLGDQVALAIQQAELYQQVQKALTQEKELNELKSRFVSMASHEFRTPLSTILSSADLLEYYVQQMSIDKTLEHIQRIQASCLNMTELLNDILVIGRAESGKLDFKPSPLDIVGFCGDLVKEMQLTVESKYKLTFVSQDQYIAACMDEKLLRHILTNLLSNAIKYSPNGGNVQLRLLCQGGAAIFQIEDEGIGIPKQDQPHLFESFHRAKNVGTIPGTGLGLAIVKRFVDLQGGQIAIASAIGVGTTVTVTLPLNSSSQTNEEDSGN